MNKMNSFKSDFAKYHGLGNDFVIFAPEYSENISFSPEKAEKICDRNFGVGADGVLLLKKTIKSGVNSIPCYELTIYNSDGSRAEMCGNGVRCVTHYLRDRDLIDEKLELKTGAGLIKPQIKGYSPDKARALVKVNMGVPEFSPNAIPVREDYLRKNSERYLHDGDNKLFKAKFNFIEKKEFTGFTANFVSMGNPHVIFFIDDKPECIPLERWGPIIEEHDLFPEDTNVEFAKIIDDNKIEVRVWERGSGITLACGTGAAAVAAAAINNGYCGKKVDIKLPGGRLGVEYDSDNIYIIGPSQKVFRGNLDMKL